MKYEVTMEKSYRFSFEIEVDDYRDIDDAIGDYDHRFLESGLSERDCEYNYAVCDENGYTVMDWE